MKADPILRVCGELLRFILPSTIKSAHVFSPLGNDANPHVGVPSPCWRKPKASLNKSPVSPLPSITVTDWPVWRRCQLRVDRLTGRKCRSAARARLCRLGVENRCAGPVWHWQLLPHQHFNPHHVPPTLVSLRQWGSPGSRGGFPGANRGQGLLQTEGFPGP